MRLSYPLAFAMIAVSGTAGGIHGQPHGSRQELGAEVVDNVTIPGVIDRLNSLCDGNLFETQRAMDAYLASHPNAGYKSLREILLSGLVAPARARTLMATVGKSPDDLEYATLLRNLSHRGCASWPPLARLGTVLERLGRQRP